MLHRRILVNGAFRPQRTTGQQRYAAEIANRLIEAGARQVVPGEFWGASALRTWLWTLFVLPVRARGRVLVSLTARAPLWHPRQALAVHDLFVLTDPDWYSSRYIWTHAPLLRLQLRTARGLTAVSEPVAEQLRAQGLEAQVAPNAPSAVFSGGGDAAVLARLGLASGRFLVAVGSKDPRKNLDRLAAAWTAVPEADRLAVPLVVIGAGGAIFRQQSVAWPTGTIDAGYVSDAELAALYAGARGIVFVSLAEGFGLPIVEAAAAGSARLLLSDLPVFRRIAGDAATYVDPRSTAAITAGLVAVLGDAAPHPAIDLDRFAWDRSAKTVLAVAKATGRP